MILKIEILLFLLLLIINLAIGFSEQLALKATNVILNTKKETMIAAGKTTIIVIGTIVLFFCKIV